MQQFLCVVVDVAWKINLNFMVLFRSFLEIEVQMFAKGGDQRPGREHRTLRGRLS
jgi:hypothetical protein